MGQATQAAAAASAIDLPDPTEPGAAPAGAGLGTDDLLAQLAGDEIDRLLAEAEVERPPARQPAAAAAAPKAPPSASTRTDDDALLPSDPFVPTAPAEGLTGDAFVPAAPADGTILRGAPPAGADDAGGTLLAAAEATEDPALSQELDALFANLDAKTGPPAAAPPPPAPAAVLDQLTPGHFPQARTQTTAPAAAPADLEEADTSAAERAALDAELEESATEVVPAKADAAAPTAEGEDGRVPFYVRVLEWLNAPLAACSDATRELVGKIAVLTLVNAIAVLAYVLFVR